MRHKYLFMTVALIFSGSQLFSQYTDIGSGATATATNSNGTVVVGDVGSEHFMWTASSGVTLIGGVGPQGYGGQTGVNAAGTLISGTRINPQTGLGELSIYEIAAQTWTSYGGIGGSSGSSTSSAWGMSSDGSTVVGLGWVNAGSAHAIRYDTANGMFDLGSTVSGSSSRANACNADGSIIAGWQDATNGFRQAAVWTNGVQELLTHNGGGLASEAGCISGDGIWVGGGGNSNNNYQAYRWSSSTGISAIGPAPVNGWRGSTTSISHDGSTIVGFYRPWPAPATLGNGFIYTDSDGMQDLTLLATSLGMDLQGRTLALPLGISADGSTVVGIDNTGSGFVVRLGQSTAINDLCSNAIEIECFTTVTGSTTNATDSGGNASDDVFYKFLANGATQQTITLSLCSVNTNFDTVLRVFDNCDLSNEIVSNDDSCGVQSELSFENDGVSDYFIMVEGNGATGDFELLIDCVTLIGIADAQWDSFSFGPNPSSHFVDIRHNQAIDQVVVYTILGQKQYQASELGTQSRIDISGWSSGVYLMSVNINQQQRTFKLIKA